MEWISVKDKLPNKNELVLCRVNDFGNEFTCIGEHSVTGAFWFQFSYQSLDKVTHWMPLPKPPNE